MAMGAAESDVSETNLVTVAFTAVFIDRGQSTEDNGEADEQTVINKEQ